MSYGYLYFGISDFTSVKTHRSTFNKSPGFTGGGGKTDCFYQCQQTDLSILEQRGINFLRANFLG